MGCQYIVWGGGGERGKSTLMGGRQACEQEENGGRGMSELKSTSVSLQIAQRRRGGLSLREMCRALRGRSEDEAEALQP